jgi:hypothetical protein
MAFVQPLDLQTIFVNYFAGSMTIFFFIIMAVLAYLAAKFRMPNQITLIMIVLFVIFFASYYSLLYVIVIFLIGLLIYYSLSKFMKS